MKAHQVEEKYLKKVKSKGTDVLAKKFLTGKRKH